MATIRENIQRIWDGKNTIKNTLNNIVPDLITDETKIEDYAANITKIGRIILGPIECRVDTANPERLMPVLFEVQNSNFSQETFNAITKYNSSGTTTFTVTGASNTTCNIYIGLPYWVIPTLLYYTASGSYRPTKIVMAVRDAVNATWIDLYDSSNYTDIGVRNLIRPILFADNDMSKFVFRVQNNIPYIRYRIIFTGNGQISLRNLYYSGYLIPWLTY